MVLLVLGLCALRQVLPPDWRGALVLGALLPLPLAAPCAERWPARPWALAGALLSALSLGALALHSPELWLQTSLAAALVLGAGVAQRGLRARPVAFVLSLGVLAPLLLGALIAAASASGRALLKGELGDWQLGFASLARSAHWLAFALALLYACVPAPLGRPARWPSALALAALLLVLAPRLAWLATTLTLPTDLLIWSEPPLLLNLWKIREKAVFYGPFAELNSYSYSPLLEHLQYWLLRPLGLELSLRAHRSLGVLWQLLAAACLLATLARFLRPGRRAAWALAAACAGLLFTTLLAPHLHPDHLLMLSLSAAIWLVAGAERPAGARLWLLVALPVLATMVKLTGAGIGLGLVLVYLRERDWRSLAWLALAGALALATVPLFDATLGNFSAYAVRLQASHPIDVARALSVGTTAPLACFFVAALSCVLCWRQASPDPAPRAALRVLLLTVGIGVTSLAAYAKHGGRDNSLLPFTLGGSVALLLALSPPEGADRAAAAVTRGALFPALAALLAIITPFAPPVLGERRAELSRMHQTIVAWLRRSAAENQRVFAMSTAAYLDAGWRRIPNASLETLAELSLAKRPEVALFEARVQNGDYDALQLSASSLRLTDVCVRLLPTLERDYVVVGPPELGGAWPRGVGGYVIAERRVRRGPAHDIR